MVEPFLRIPPFPGHRSSPIAEGQTGGNMPRAEALELIELLRKEAVGGSFWAGKADLPAGRSLILAPSSGDQLLQMLNEAHSQGVADRCVVVVADGSRPVELSADVPFILGPVDPWYVARQAAEIWSDADAEIAVVGQLIGKPVRLFGTETIEGIAGDQELARIIERRVGGWRYRCPYRGGSITALEAAKLLVEWRRLIDGNRGIEAVFGVAHWKRPTVDSMLWSGSGASRHSRQIPQRSGAEVVVWKSRTNSALLQQLDKSGARIREIEDGMIRGPGLGANCIPPLSIVVDRRGIYFDPSEPSDLELLLQNAEFDSHLIQRAARLRRRIVEVGISKYGSANRAETHPSAGKRRILVVGQVEDDRSILSGGGGQTNLELLERARALEPDALLIYRPHPDVEAGHRKGHVPDAVALRLADQIDRAGSINGLIGSVDEVHCITSLAGFEALIRGKPVTSHGVPFYAGWGLTRDLGPIPPRRSRRLSLDELVAATLILYPRYLDPVTMLPCPPEVLVERIAHGEASIAAPLAGMRALQGKLKLAMRRLKEAAA